MLSLLTLGFLNWGAFVYVGMRVKRYRWCVAGAIYLLPVVAYMLLSSPEGKPTTSLADTALDVQLVVWLISLVHGVVIRNDYMQRLAALEDPAAGLADLEGAVPKAYSPSSLGDTPAEESGFRHDWKTGALVSRRKFGANQGLMRHVEPARPMPDAEVLGKFQRMALLQQIAVGEDQPDVTEPPVELVDLLRALERDRLIEVDAANVCFALTPEGMRQYDTWMEQGQALVRAYDIYGDVDEDASGTFHFDTDLGKDLRVALFESEGLDPFQARVLLALNDREWVDIHDWATKISATSWLQQVLAPVCEAPTAESIGPERLAVLKDQAKERLRRGRPLEV
jgi:hypothetical protein